jgi:nucleoside phosphorylase
MNATQSLNPLLPADFKLDLHTSPKAKQIATGPATQPIQKEGRNKKKGKAARTVRPRAKRMKKEKVTENPVAKFLTKRLGKLKSEKLRTVLVGLGIAAAVAALIVTLLKLAPIGVLLVLLVGAAGAMHIWERVRYRPMPF